MNDDFRYPTIKFKQMVFLGNGDRSEEYINDLHALVDEALSTLCGMQQWPDHGGEIEEVLIDCLVEVCRAFGYHVDTWKKLPYGSEI